MIAPTLRPIRISCASFAAILFAVATAAPVRASETVHYTYDARGRVVEVERVQPTGTVKTKYIYDRADNRTKKTTTVN